MGGDRARRLNGARGVLLAAVEGVLGGVFALRDGATTPEFLIALLLALSVSYAGVRLLTPIQDGPIFTQRRRWAFAFTVLLAGPLAAAGIPHLHNVSLAQATLIAAASGLCLYWFVAFTISPKRGGGWIMRLTSRRGMPLCPHCRMATTSNRATCFYCGKDLPAGIE